MTKQEIFNKVAKHLLTQKAKAGSVLGLEFVCRYRADNDMTCAIGCLIPDDLYNPDFEGRSYDGLNCLSSGNKVWEFLGGKETEKFLIELQRIHDDVDEECWKQHLSWFAGKHKLDQTILTTL